MATCITSTVISMLDAFPNNSESLPLDVDLSADLTGLLMKRRSNILISPSAAEAESNTLIGEEAWFRCNE